MKEALRSRQFISTCLKLSGNILVFVQSSCKNGYGEGRLTVIVLVCLPMNGLGEAFALCFLCVQNFAQLAFVAREQDISEL